MKAKQKSKHVLLVEDNLLNQKFAMAVLKNERIYLGF